MKSKTLDVAHDEKHPRPRQPVSWGQHRDPAAAHVAQGRIVTPMPSAVLVGVKVTDGRLPASCAAANCVRELPPAEMDVLTSRFVVLCLAVLDAVTTLLGVLSALRASPWGHLGTVLLVGPTCGLQGARTLNRNLVAVHFSLSIVKLVLEVVMVELASTSVSFVCFILLAAFELLIVKNAVSFWLALRVVDPARRQELAKTTRVQDGLIFW